MIMQYCIVFLSNSYRDTNTNSCISCLFQVQMHALFHIINYLLTLLVRSSRILKIHRAEKNIILRCFMFRNHMLQHMGTKAIKNYKMTDDGTLCDRLWVADLRAAAFLPPHGNVDIKLITTLCIIKLKLNRKYATLIG